MKILCVFAVLVAIIFSCGRAKQPDTALPIETEKNAFKVEVVEPLSTDALVGYWLLLNSEGERDNSGNYLLLEKSGDEVKGIFIYQNYKRKCKVVFHNEFFIVSERGERYKVTRVQSTDQNENNGISLALDDIDLGVFQREDILKKVTQ